MRIGLDYRPASVAPYSGIGRQVRALQRFLKEQHQVLCFSEAPLNHPQRQTAFCPPWSGDWQGLQRPQVRWRFERNFLPKALKQYEVQLYIATANMGLPLGRKARGQKQVLLLHDLFQLTEHNFHRSKVKALAYRMIDTLSIAWSAWRADRIWCPSQFSAHEAARLFPWTRDKLRVLPNWVEPLAASAEPLPALPSRYWLVVGTREPRKNLPRFLRLWQKARQQQPATPDLVLVGHPHDAPDELRRIDGLHWLNGLSDGQLRTLYQQAECLWQPSWAEGFGLPVIEALSVGTPVAVASGSALDEITPAALPRFTPHDDAALLACLIQLAQSPLPRDPAWLDWAQRYGDQAYRARLTDLLKDLA